MFNATDILAAVLIPFACAYGGYWLVRSTLRRAPATSVLAGFVVAFVIGQLALESRGDWAQADSYWSWLTHGASACAGNVATLISPRVARNWLAWCVIVAAVASVCKQSAVKWPAVVASLVVAMCLPARLLWSSVYLQQWDLTTIASLVGLGLLVFASWQYRGRTGAEDRSLCAWLTLATVGATSLTLAMSGSITYGQHGGALASAVFGVIVAAIVFRDAMDWTLADGPVTVAFAGLLIVGAFFAELTVVHAVLLGSAMILSRPIDAFDRFGKSVSRWIAVALVAILLTLVVVQAGMRFSESIPSGGDAYAVDRPEMDIEHRTRNVEV